MSDPLTADAKAALQLVPVAKAIMDTVRGMLPEGTHFGLMLLVPGAPEGRVVALTTDRDVVAPAVAHWVLDVMGPQTKAKRG